jgi:hypothetical protein
MPQMQVFFVGVPLSILLGPGAARGRRNGGSFSLVESVLSTLAPNR